MQKSIIILSLIIFNVSIIFAGCPTKVDDRFSPAGEAWVLETTEWLEKNPLADTDKLCKTELLTWWTEVPYLTLEWCADLLIDAENKKISGIIVLQGVFGSGAYLIKHRHEPADELALRLAGVESALKAYKTAVAQDDSMRDSFFDNLLQKQAKGDLDKYVLSKCKKAESK